MRTWHAAVVALLVVMAGCSTASPPPGEAEGEAPADGATPAPTGTATATAAAGPNGTLEVHFVNVGQSVATLVVGPTGETMLIDSGHYDDDGEHVLAYLRDQGIERLDYLVTSHGDADHIGGHAAVIEYYETEADGVGAVYDPGIAASTQTYAEYLDAVEAHDVDLFETRAGDGVPMEGVEADVLGPPEPYLAGEERNENSLVLRLTFGTTTFLFTGDAERQEEAYLVEEYGDGLRATVLKAGHHGSKSSTSGDLLDAADPQAVVVSSAYDSRYGHPHEEVLDRLAARSIPTYWTGTHGDVVLESDGRDVRVKTGRAAPTDARSLRAGDPVEAGSTRDVQVRALLEARGGLATVTPAESGGTATPTVATDGGTTTATATGESAGTLALVEVHADAAGDDRENLNDEYLVFENTGTEPLDLSGWTVTDEADKTYRFPDGFELGPGERVTLHTGSGEDTATDLYWGASSPVWNNGGDVVTVRNDEETVVLQGEY